MLHDVIHMHTGICTYKPSHQAMSHVPHQSCYGALMLESGSEGPPWVDGTAPAMHAARPAPRVHPEPLTIVRPIL